MEVIASDVLIQVMSTVPGVAVSAGVFRDSVKGVTGSDCNQVSCVVPSVCIVSSTAFLFFSRYQSWMIESQGATIV